MFRVPYKPYGIYANVNGIIRFIPLPVFTNINLNNKNSDEISSAIKKYVDDVVNKMKDEIVVPTGIKGLPGPPGLQGKEGPQGPKGEDAVVNNNEIITDLRKYIIDNISLFINEIKNDTNFTKEVCKNCATEFNNKLKKKLEDLKKKLSKEIDEKLEERDNNIYNIINHYLTFSKAHQENVPKSKKTQPNKKYDINEKYKDFDNACKKLNNVSPKKCLTTNNFNKTKETSGRYCMEMKTKIGEYEKGTCRLGPHGKLRLS